MAVHLVTSSVTHRSAKHYLFFNARHFLCEQVGGIQTWIPWPPLKRVKQWLTSGSINQLEVSIKQYYVFIAQDFILSVWREATAYRQWPQTSVINADLSWIKQTIFVFNARLCPNKAAIATRPPKGWRRSRPVGQRWGPRCLHISHQTFFVFHRKTWSCPNQQYLFWSVRHILLK